MTVSTLPLLSHFSFFLSGDSTDERRLNRSFVIVIFVTIKMERMAVNIKLKIFLKKAAVLEKKRRQ